MTFLAGSQVSDRCTLGYLFYPSDGAMTKYMFYFISAGSRLHRGYCYEAVMDDKPVDITHLVFVIHGIGQKMDTGAIVKSCSE